MSDFHVTVLLHQWDINNSEFDINTLIKAGVNHVTIPIMWSRVEKNENEYSWSYYNDIVDKIVASGLNLIILLDAGGRSDFNEDGSWIPGSSVFPHYVRAPIEYQAMDFYGELTPQLNFTNEDAMRHVEKFYQNATSHFSERYGSRIFAFAISIQSEFEIKYGQTGYKWRDYSPATKSKFENETGLIPPVVDFSRSIGGTFSPSPSFAEWMKFRQNNLVEVVKKLSNIIHASGHRSIGYFGEVFTSHDAIMGLSVLGELGTVLDAAVVDYNFYDGWINQPNPWKIPMMANYARSLGYKYVFGGYYVERWRLPVGEPGSPVDPAIYPIVAQSIFECRWRDLIDGIEIGGFGDMSRDLQKLNEPMLYSAINNPSRMPVKNRIRVGILASHTTYEWFTGERYNDMNVHSEAITKTFEMISCRDDFEPIVISEKIIKNSPDLIKSLDVIYAPHQPAVSNEVIGALSEIGNDTLIMQDIRFGEWSDNGESRDGWFNDFFGISGIGWRDSGDYDVGGKTVHMGNSRYLQSSHAIVFSDKGEIIVKALEDNNLGLFLKYLNRMTIGYVPALVEGKSAEIWRNLFFDVIKETVAIKSR